MAWSSPVGYVHIQVEHTPEMNAARLVADPAWMESVSDAILRANERVAKLTREEAVRNLANSIVRPAQRTGRLEEAVADERSTEATATRITIGVADFLDKKARYWRAVEEGAPGLADVVFYGFWTRAPRLDRGKVPLEGPMEGERSGRPIVMSVNEPPEGKKYFFAWTIHNIPDAKRYFSDAWHTIRPEINALYREELRHARGPSGRPLSFVRGHERNGRPVRPFIRRS